MGLKRSIESQRNFTTSASSNMMTSSSFQMSSIFKSSPYFYRKSKILPTNRSTQNLMSTRGDMLEGDIIPLEEINVLENEVKKEGIDGRNDEIYL